MLLHDIEVNELRQRVAELDFLYSEMNETARKYLTKNQSLFNALMNSTAYSDILNEQIKRARGHMNLYRLFSCEGSDSYDPECAEKNLDKVMEILSESIDNAIDEAMK